MQFLMLSPLDHSSERKMALRAFEKARSNSGSGISATAAAVGSASGNVVTTAVVVGDAVVVGAATVVVGDAVVVGAAAVVVGDAVVGASVEAGATEVVCASSASTFSRNACNSAESLPPEQLDAARATAKPRAIPLFTSRYRSR
jgi:hypothetical protein